jgi:hypothetical protein
VTRPPTAGHDDPHGRFAAWLLAAVDDDPPRDLAVHASVCSACQFEIAALDMLTAIDLSRAGMPPPRAIHSRGRLGAVGRVAVAVSGVAALAAIGVGGWRLAEAGGLMSGAASEAPTQAVLGNTGHPEAAPAASPSAGASITPEESSGPPSPSPAATPGTVPLPPPAVVTPRPTAAPSRTPRPSIIISSPTPAPTEEPSPTPIPTPVPTLEPSPTPAPAAAA